MSDLNQNERWRELGKRWRKIMEGMTLAEVEQIMGFSFAIDSENEAGRMVFSHHTADYLPFYLAIDRASSKVMRKHDIRALDEL